MSYTLNNMLLFFAQNGIYLVIIVSFINFVINFKNETKTVIALFLSMLISYAISFIFYFPRPFVKENFTPLIPHSPDSGFPSHHATAGFTMASSTFFTNYLLGFLSFAITILISAGRVYAGLHTISDIIGGLIIGVCCSLFAYSTTMEKIIKKNKLFKKYFF